MQGEAIPKKIGKYEVLSVLGRGGMGVVYRGLDPFIGRAVAIKTVTEDFIRDPVMLRRFYSEAEKTGMLAHPHIVIVFDVGEQDGYPYLVMEYVEGEPLDRVIADRVAGSGQPLSLIAKLKIVEQVCGALGYAHQRGMVHRDVKPANVIVQPDGTAKLLDFGIARQETMDRDLSLTVTGSVIGTVPYMAPERLKGAPLDGRSDIFAVGVLLYQLLTGRLPFEGNEGVLVQKLLHEQPPPLSRFLQEYPVELEQVVERALAKEPHDRFATAEEMGAELGGTIHALTQGEAASLLAQAEGMAAGGDLEGARGMLLQVLRLETQNRRARALLVEVQERLAQRQRWEQAEGMAEQARTALREQQPERAVALLEQAARLVPEDAAMGSAMGSAIRAALEEARERQRVAEQIDGYVRQADAARGSGDFPAARTILERALALDAGSSRLRSIHASVIRQAEERARRERVRGLLEEARGQMKARQPHAALQTLEEAEALDALDTELQELRQAARGAIREEQRRRVVEEVELQVHAAGTPEEVERAAALVSRALDTLPSDSALLRMQAELQRQQRVEEEKRLVDETVRRCRAVLETDPAAALQVVRAAMERLPGHERLLALQSAIEARLAHLAREQRRAGQMTAARAALTGRDFAEAIRILTVCEQEEPTTDTRHLLELAKGEWQAQQRKELLARHYPPAEALLRAGDAAGVVALLGPVLAGFEEPGLRGLLEQARARMDEAAVARAEQLGAGRAAAAAEDYEGTLALLGGIEGAEIEAERAKARAGMKREWEELQFVGRCFAGGGEKGMRREVGARAAKCRDSAFLAGMYGVVGR